MGNYIQKPVESREEINANFIKDCESMNVYDFSKLTEEEKNKVLSIIKQHIEKYYSKNKPVGTYSFCIPKYVRLDNASYFNDRYFNIATAAFCTEINQHDDWRHTNGNFLPSPIMINNNNELIDVIVGEIMKYNKTQFTIDYNYKLFYVDRGGAVRYDNEPDRISKIYGNTKSYYPEYDTHYSSIFIKIQNMYTPEVT